MILRNHISICIFFVLGFLVFAGCQGGGDALLPGSNDQPGIQSTADNNQSRDSGVSGGPHHLLLLYECRVDFENGVMEAAPMRSALQHLNLVELIPVFCKPPSACLDFENLVLDFVNATAEVDVVVTHPIPDAFADVYDLRGIMIVQGTIDPGFDEGPLGLQLLNRDGFTTVYDAAGLYDSFANPYIAFNKDEPKRIFENGSTTIEHFSVQFPSMEGDDTKFLYALDASWYNVNQIDPDDPLTDPNMAEPYQVNILYADPMKDAFGSEATVIVETYDWQENAAGAAIQIPDLFSDAVDMTEVWSGGGRFLYYANAVNAFDMEAGSVAPLLVKAWDEFPTQPDLLHPTNDIELTNYQLGNMIVYNSATNTAPVVSVVVDDINVKINDAVHFDATASYDAEDGTVTVYDWDLDGDWVPDVTGEAEFDYQYSAEGTYPVNVKVTDSGGLTDVLDMPIIITVTPSINTPPVASAFASNYNPLQGQQITLNASASQDLEDGKPVSWDWDLDNDGEYDDKSGEIIQYSWSSAGTYNVDVLVKDSGGLGDTLDQKLVINVQAGANNPPTAAAEADKYVAGVGETIKFDGSESNDPEDGGMLLYQWDMYGNETYMDHYGVVVNHKYWAPSTYEVDLRVTDSGGLSDTLDEKLSIIVIGEPNQPPVAIATADKHTAAVLETIHFDASASYDPEEGDVSIYRWDLNGDGNYTDAFTPEVDYFYLFPGEYEVDVRVCDTPGECDTLDQKLVIQILEEGNHPPVAIATADKTFVYEGDSVLFNASDSYDPDDGSPTSLGWDMDNDGLYDDSPFVVQLWQFNTEGVYPIDLKVTDKEGAWDTLDTKLMITVVPIGSDFPPEAIGSVNCAFPKVGQTIQFTSQSTDIDGEIVKWEWDFNEGGGWEDYTSTEGVADYAYSDDGIYYVKLRVTDDGDVSDELDFPIQVFVTLPSYIPPSDPPSCPAGLMTHNFAAAGMFDQVNTTVTSRDLAFLPGGSFLVVVADSLVQCLPPSMIMPPTLLYGAGWIQSIDISPLGLIALSGLSSGAIKVYATAGGDVSKMDLVTQFNAGMPVSAITFDGSENLWVYGEGELRKYTSPGFQTDPCSTYLVPEIETLGVAQDMVWSTWNHSIYMVLNDGEGGTVVEIDHMGSVAGTITDVLDGPSNYMDIVADCNTNDADAAGCRIEVFGGINQTYVTRLNADLDVLARGSYGFWGARAAALSPQMGNEVLILEDCCISWVDLLIPAMDWNDMGGG